jgi:tetratricopeptide (TPR) repeat protein
MRSYKAQTSAFVIAAFLAAAPFARADKKDDLYAKGTAAVNAGDAIGARDAFCEVAKIDPEYKEAKGNCVTYTAEATKTLNRFNQNYLEGLQLMQDGKYDQAEFKFRNVKPPSPRVDDAKVKLQQISQLKQDKAAADAAAKNNADQDAQMKGKLDQGIDAYNRGDFGSAKGSLGGVSGKYQGEAQNYLTKIRNYEAKMAEAAADATNKNYSGAAAAYTEAVRINASGPGDPLGQVAKMNQLAATSSAPPAVTPANNPPPAKAAATKDVVKTIDVDRYVAEGQKALQKGDFKKARRYFQEVLGQDSHNQEATNGMAELKTRDTAQAAATDEDPLLAKLIRGFYEGNYNDVESLLNNYIYSGQGKKVGLANFYAGASMLTRYYLAGATDENLRREAKKKFKAAKEVEGFKAPEKFISPKIMKAFQEAS